VQRNGKEEDSAVSSGVNVEMKREQITDLKGLSGYRPLDSNYSINRKYLRLITMQEQAGEWV
jgi:hypothetical protein